MDRQCLRKASFLLLVIAFGFASASITAAPIDDGSTARQQASSAQSWFSAWVQDLWESVLSVAGTALEPDLGENPPETPNGEPNSASVIDPIG